MTVETDTLIFRPRAEITGELDSLTEQYTADPDRPVSLERALEESTLVGEAALLALRGNNYRMVEDVPGRVIFPYDAAVQSRSRDSYYVGLSETPDRIVLYANVIEASSTSRTLGHVSVPKHMRFMPTVGGRHEDVFASLTDRTAVHPLLDRDPSRVKDFGRIIGHAAAWVSYALAR